jgi:uncharacterized lipoprotein YajG
MRAMCTPRRLTALAAFLTLAACGATPTPPAATPPAPDLESVLGGGYVLACWGAQTLTA